MTDPRAVRLAGRRRMKSAFVEKGKQTSDAGNSGRSSRISGRKSTQDASESGREQPVTSDFGNYGKISRTRGKKSTQNVVEKQNLDPESGNEQPVSGEIREITDQTSRARGKKSAKTDVPADSKLGIEALVVVKRQSRRKVINENLDRRNDDVPSRAQEAVAVPRRYSRRAVKVIDSAFMSSDNLPATNARSSRQDLPNVDSECRQTGAGVGVEKEVQESTEAGTCQSETSGKSARDASRRKYLAPNDSKTRSDGYVAEMNSRKRPRELDSQVAVLDIKSGDVDSKQGTEMDQIVPPRRSRRRTLADKSVTVISETQSDATDENHSPNMDSEFCVDKESLVAREHKNRCTRTANTRGGKRASSGTEETTKAAGEAKKRKRRGDTVPSENVTPVVEQQPPRRSICNGSEDDVLVTRRKIDKDAKKTNDNGSVSSDLKMEAPSPALADEQYPRGSWKRKVGTRNKCSARVNTGLKGVLDNTKIMEVDVGEIPVAQAKELPKVSESGWVEVIDSMEPYLHTSLHEKVHGVLENSEVTQPKSVGEDHDGEGRESTNVVAFKRSFSKHIKSNADGQYAEIVNLKSASRCDKGQSSKEHPCLGANMTDVMEESSTTTSNEQGMVKVEEAQKLAKDNSEMVHNDGGSYVFPLDRKEHVTAALNDDASNSDNSGQGGKLLRFDEPLFHYKPTGMMQPGDKGTRKSTTPESFDVAHHGQKGLSLYRSVLAADGKMSAGTESPELLDQELSMKDSRKKEYEFEEAPIPEDEHSEGNLVLVGKFVDVFISKEGETAEEESGEPAWTQSINKMDLVAESSQYFSVKEQPTTNTEEARKFLAPISQQLVLKELEVDWVKNSKANEISRIVAEEPKANTFLRSHCKEQRTMSRSRGSSGRKISLNVGNCSDVEHHDVAQFEELDKDHGPNSEQSGIKDEEAKLEETEVVKVRDIATDEAVGYTPRPLDSEGSRPILLLDYDSEAVSIGKDSKVHHIVPEPTAPFASCIGNTSATISVSDEQFTDENQNRGEALSRSSLPRKSIYSGSKEESTVFLTQSEFLCKIAESNEGVEFCSITAKDDGHGEAASLSLLPTSTAETEIMCSRDTDTYTNDKQESGIVDSMEKFKIYTPTALTVAETKLGAVVGHSTIAGNCKTGEDLHEVVGSKDRMEQVTTEESTLLGTVEKENTCEFGMELSFTGISGTVAYVKGVESGRSENSSMEARASKLLCDSVAIESTTTVPPYRVDAAKCIPAPQLREASNPSCSTDIDGQMFQYDRPSQEFVPSQPTVISESAAKMVDEEKIDAQSLQVASFCRNASAVPETAETSPESTAAIKLCELEANENEQSSNKILAVADELDYEAAQYGSELELSRLEMSWQNMKIPAVALGDIPLPDEEAEESGKIVTGAEKSLEETPHMESAGHSARTVMRSIILKEGEENDETDDCGVEHCSAEELALMLSELCLDPKEREGPGVSVTSKQWDHTNYFDVVQTDGDEGHDSCRSLDVDGEQLADATGQTPLMASYDCRSLYRLSCGDGNQDAANRPEEPDCLSSYGNDHRRGYEASSRERDDFEKPDVTCIFSSWEKTLSPEEHVCQQDTGAADNYSAMQPSTPAAEVSGPGYNDIVSSEMPCLYTDIMEEDYNNRAQEEHTIRCQQAAKLKGYYLQVAAHTMFVDEEGHNYDSPRTERHMSTVPLVHEVESCMAKEEAAQWSNSQSDNVFQQSTHEGGSVAGLSTCGDRESDGNNNIKQVASKEDYPIGIEDFYSSNFHLPHALQHDDGDKCRAIPSAAAMDACPSMSDQPAEPMTFDEEDHSDADDDTRSEPKTKSLRENPEPELDALWTASCKEDNRSILIHGTSKRVGRKDDMKENKQSMKMEEMLNLTAVKPRIKRKALQDLRKN